MYSTPSQIGPTFNGRTEFLYKRIPLYTPCSNNFTNHSLARFIIYNYIQICTLKNNSQSYAIEDIKRYYLQCSSYEKSKNASGPSDITLENEIKIMLPLKRVIAIK